MALPHRRVTELRDGFGQRGQQNHDSGIHSASSPMLGSSPSDPSPVLPSEPQPFSSSEPMEDQDQVPRRGRGRPKKRLNSSAKRGIIRLFVEMSKTPLRQITKAIEQIDGHGKLWVRAFLEDVSGAGLKSDHRLREIRFDGDNPTLDQDNQKNTEYDLRSNSTVPASSIPQDPRHESFSQPDDLRTLSQCSSSDESNPRYKAPRRTTSHVFANVSNQQFTRQDPSPSEPPRKAVQGGTPTFARDYRAIGTSPSIPPRTWNDVISSAEASAAEQKSVPPPQTSIQFQDRQMAIPDRGKRYAGDEGDNRGGNIKGRRQVNFKGRGPSLTLTNVAIILDGGIKGIHYQVAKMNTIRRRMSSATSEFNRFYRRPTNTIIVPLPTPCPYPLSANILPVHSQNASRPEAVATNVIATVWAEGLTDIDARKQLEAMLPTHQGELKAFVSAQDDFGASPLHLAVAYGYPSTCQLLLHHGADPKAKTNKGTNIYDFAESAARRTGEDFALYFRILHCRKFACAGEEPPAPRKSTKKGLAKRKKSAGKGKASAIPGYRAPGCTGLHINTGLANQRGSDPCTTNVSVTDVPGATPQWAPEYTYSPTTSTIRKHLSLPLDDEEDKHASYGWRPSRRSTAAVPFPTSSHYSRPSLSLVGSRGNELITLDPYGSQGVPVSQHRVPPIAMSNKEREGSELGAIFEHGNNGAQRPVPQPYMYSSSRQQPRQPLARPLAFGPFGFSQNQVNPALRRNVPVNTSRAGNVSYGLATPAWAIPNHTSAAIDFAHVNPVGTGPYSDMMQAPMYQGGYPPPFQGNLNPLPATIYDYQQNTLHQQSQQPFNNQQNVYDPQAMAQSSMQGTTCMPYVSVAAHTGAAANNPDVIPGVRICPFNNILCDGVSLCEPCFNVIFLSNSPQLCIS